MITILPVNVMCFKQHKEYNVDNAPFFTVEEEDLGHIKWFVRIFKYAALSHTCTDQQMLDLGPNVHIP